jgi:hypothetical protein
MTSGREQPQAEAEPEAVELVLFQVAECYVYLIPPRMTAASYRADEWNVNKWAWEGALKVASKGEECVIKLEDKSTGELYARAFLREGEPHPVEAVIDSSRYFVLRVEENIDGRQRHAFIGLGFRERTEAYDFQAALHDHMKYPFVHLGPPYVPCHLESHTNVSPWPCDHCMTWTMYVEFHFIKTKYMFSTIDYCCGT